MKNWVSPNHRLANKSYIWIKLQQFKNAFYSVVSCFVEYVLFIKIRKKKFFFIIPLCITNIMILINVQDVPKIVWMLKIRYKRYQWTFFLKKMKTLSYSYNVHIEKATLYSRIIKNFYIETIQLMVYLVMQMVCGKKVFYLKRLTLFHVPIRSWTSAFEKKTKYLFATYVQKSILFSKSFNRIQNISFSDEHV